MKGISRAAKMFRPVPVLRAFRRMVSRPGRLLLFGLTSLAMAGLVPTTMAVDGQKTCLVVPVLFRKNDPGLAIENNLAASKQEPGDIRNAWLNTYEPFWKQASYNRFTVKTKTYGYFYMQWGKEPRGGRGPDFSDPGNNVFGEGIGEGFTEKCSMGGTPIFDGQWTPGERFVDVNGNAKYDLADPWTDSINAAIAGKTNGLWDSHGERFADLDNNGRYSGPGTVQILVYDAANDQGVAPFDAGGVPRDGIFGPPNNKLSQPAIRPVNLDELDTRGLATLQDLNPVNTHGVHTLSTFLGDYPTQDYDQNGLPGALTARNNVFDYGPSAVNPIYVDTGLTLGYWTLTLAWTDSATAPPGSYTATFAFTTARIFETIEPYTDNDNNNAWSDREPFEDYMVRWDPTGGATGTGAWVRMTDRYTIDNYPGNGSDQKSSRRHPATTLPPTAGTLGFTTNMFYIDQNAPLGVYSAGDNIWQEMPGGIPGIYDPGKDLLINDGGSLVTQAGIHGNLLYADVNSNVRYDAGEAIWADTNGNARYDVTDVQVVGYPWTVALNTAGINATLYFIDKNANGQYDYTESIFRHTDAGSAYNVRSDLQIPSDTQLWVPLTGRQDNLRYNDANGNNRWDTGEAIWAENGVSDNTYTATDTPVFPTPWVLPVGRPGKTTGLRYVDTNGSSSYTLGELIFADSDGNGILEVALDTIIYNGWQPITNVLPFANGDVLFGRIGYAGPAPITYAFGDVFWIDSGAANPGVFGTGDAAIAGDVNGPNGIDDNIDELMDREGNGKYDGPEDCKNAGNTKMQAYGIAGDPISTSPMPNWQQWWTTTYGTPPPAWPGTFLRARQFDTAGGHGAFGTDANGGYYKNLAGSNADGPVMPDSTGAFYDSAREFADLPSSYYHSAGDGRLGEETDPRSNTIWGADYGPTFPDNNIKGAGPNATFMVEHGDSGNLLTLELLTWRTDGAANRSKAQFRDVNLDGLVDQGEAPDFGFCNYRTDLNANNPNQDGVHTSYPYNQQRLYEEAIEQLDVIEDLISFGPNGNSGPDYLVVAWPTQFGDGYLHLSGNGGSVRTLDNNQTVSFGAQPTPWTGMGMVAHEQSHAWLGAADLYDYDVWDGIYSNQPIGSGNELMAAGPMTQYIPFHTVSTFGWSSSVDLKTRLRPGVPTTVTIYPAEKNPDNYFYYTRGDNRERFWFWYESGDTNYPKASGTGLFIEHDESGHDPLGVPLAQKINNHFAQALVQADGLYHLEDGVNGGDPGDTFPGTTGKTVFTYDTTPSSQWWDQSDSGISILNIIQPANNKDPMQVVFLWNDKSIPELSFVRPPGGSTATGSYALTYDVFDVFGGSSIYLYRDNDQAAKYDAAIGSQLTINTKRPGSVRDIFTTGTSALPDGNYYFYSLLVPGPNPRGTPNYRTTSNYPVSSGSKVTLVANAVSPFTPRTYTLTCTTPGVDGTAQFAVTYADTTGGGSGTLADATAGVEYTALNGLKFVLSATYGEITHTFVAGATPDTVTLTVEAPAGEAKWTTPLSATANTGKGLVTISSLNIQPLSAGNPMTANSMLQTWSLVCSKIAIGALPAEFRVIGSETGEEVARAVADGVTAFTTAKPYTGSLTFTITEGTPKFALGDTFTFRTTGLTPYSAPLYVNNTGNPPASLYPDDNIGAADSDGDKLPDAYEYQISANLTISAGALSDTDLDGLNDLYEYWAGTDPRLKDTSGTGQWDGDIDSDGDELTNLEEQLLGTRPDMLDTDDDGLTDFEEVTTGTDPLNSASPAINRALVFDGTGGSYMQMAGQRRFALTTFTVEAWVSPDAIGFAGGTILRRVAGITSSGKTLVNYGLRVVPAAGGTWVAEAYFANATGAEQKLTAPVSTALVLGNWTHVAASYDGTLQSFTLFINGEPVISKTVSLIPAQNTVAGPVFVRGGESFKGRLDAFRIWSIAVPPSEILANLYIAVTGNTPGLVGSNTCDDGTLGNAGSDTLWNSRDSDEYGPQTRQVEDFAGVAAQDWLNDWNHAASLVGTANFVAVNDVPSIGFQDTDNDGLPDDWEITYFGDLSHDGSADTDVDKLTDRTEYLAGTDPTKIDTGSTGVSDAEKDSDGDQVTNLQEQTYGTNPGIKDSDEDGVEDGVEINPANRAWISHPAYSLSHYDPVTHALTPARSLNLNVPAVQMGAGWKGIKVPKSDRFNTNGGSWTLEAWVNPGQDAAGAILSYQVAGRPAAEIGLNLLTPYVRFMTSTGTVYTAGGTGVLTPFVSGEWRHVAGVWDAAAKSLSLYVDGILYASYTCMEAPAAGAGTLYIGGTGDASATLTDGLLDEVRVWVEPRSQAEIEAGRDLLGGTSVNPQTFAGVYMPSGSISFADRVVSFVNGNPPSFGGHEDPQATIGPPDDPAGTGAGNATAGKSLSLGNGGSVTVQFTDNLLTGSASIAKDLWIFETGAAAEPMIVEISKDGTNWIQVGQIVAGGTRGIDIDPFISSPTEVFRFVRITDDGNQPNSVADLTGADIDAVAAISSVNILVAHYVFDDAGLNIEDFSHAYPAADAATYALNSVDYGVGAANGTANWVPTANAKFIRGFFDVDNDRMPDWWQGLYWPTYVPGGSPDWDAVADPDNDGLNNLYEFWSGTNPLKNDTDNDGIADTDEDADGDGLQNLEEQLWETDPRVTDTDDDWLTDFQEAQRHTDPAGEFSPQADRLLQLNGAATAFLVLPTSGRYALASWTVETWVYPTAVRASTLIRRNLGGGVDNYALGLDASLRPYVRFTPSDRTAAVTLTAAKPLDANSWAHVAATFDSTTHVLSVVVNGVQVTSTTTVKACAVNGPGPVQTRAGEGLLGCLDEVRIWSIAESAAAIAVNMGQVLTGTEPGLVSDFSFDDGGQTVTDVVFPQDWLMGWAHAATLGTGAAMVAADSDAPVQGANDDADGDGLPDWWEMAFFGDLTATDGTGDSDGDNLKDYSEYLAGTDPLARDTGNTGVTDDLKDSDGDGLTNIKEQQIGTDPGRGDSDDDGMNDGAEWNATPRTNPVYSLSRSPAQSFSLALSTAGVPTTGINIPYHVRFNLATGWTVEGWFRSSNAAAQTGTIVSHKVGGRLQFALGVNAGVPYASFNSATETITVAATGPRATISNNEWTHLAGVYDASAQRLILVVNGTRVYERDLTDEQMPVDGSGSVTLGATPAAWTGTTLVDEVRVWSIVRTPLLLDQNRNAVVSAGTTNLVACYRFDDGGAAIEDFAHAYPVSDAGSYQLNAATYGIGVNGAGNALWLNSNAVAMTGYDDADGDRLPDWFEQLYASAELNPNAGDSDGDNVSDALEDLDNDGLNNYYEYLSGTNPNVARTDGVRLDGNLDFESDGVKNSDEQKYGSDPRYADTDDDGLDDQTEIYGGTPGNQRPQALWPISGPADQQSPVLQRGLDLTAANSRVLIPSQAKFALETWTVEAWSKPTLAATVSGVRMVVLRRAVQNLGASSEMQNFEIGLVAKTTAAVTNWTPYVRFTDTLGQVQELNPAFSLAANEWNHLGASFDPATGKLLLYVNSYPVAASPGDMRDVRSKVAGNVEAEMTVGAGGDDGAGGYRNKFTGFIDEIHVWNAVRSPDEINRGFLNIPIGGKAGNVAVVMPNGDPVHLRLEEQGIAYTPISLADVADPATYLKYTSIFFPCLCGEAPAQVPAVQQLLRDFVSGGGRMYVACWSGAYVDMPWPETSAIEHGPGYSDVTADIVDPDAAAFIGADTMVIPYGYDCVTTYDATQVQKVLTTTDTAQVRTGLIAFSFKRGQGSVVYTTYHSESGLAEGGAEGKFLAWVAQSVASTGTQCLGWFQVDGNNRVLDLTENDSFDNNWQHAAVLQMGAQATAAAHKELYYDSDGDGIADWWEVAYGLDYLKATDASEDPDGDGLTNLFEYYAGTNPLLPDTGFTGVSDADKDSDGDGLTNRTEQLLRSHAGLIDSDDDGRTDLAEHAAGTDPVNALNPARQLGLALKGAAYLEAPLQKRFDQGGSWTVESWIKLNATDSDGGTLIKRTVDSDADGTIDAVNYELGIKRIGGELRPYVRYTTNRDLNNQAVEASAGGVVVVPGTWYHVAGVYDSVAKRLGIYVNGRVEWDVQVPYLAPAAGSVGLSVTRFGEGIDGMLDQVRIWSSALTPDSLVSRVDVNSATDLVSYYRFDDGGTTIQDFGAECGRDAFAGWWHSPKLVNATLAASIVASDVPLTNSSFDADGDGLPDWWEVYYFGSTALWDGMGDPDGDGLSNRYEYLAGTSPILRRSINDGRDDGNRDPDADGLTNLYEQQSGTMPQIADTDDDGLSDGEEVWGVNNTGSVVTARDPGGMASNPTESLDPLVSQVMTFDSAAGGYLAVPPQARQALTNWTLESWVKPALSETDGGILIRHELPDSSINYELGLEPSNGVLIPYARFTAIGPDNQTQQYKVGGKALYENPQMESSVHILVTTWPILVRPGQWTHVAASADTDANRLNLYVNGRLVAYRRLMFGAPDVEASLPGVLTIGGIAGGTAAQSITGSIDEVRIWGGARSDADILANYQTEISYDKIRGTPATLDIPAAMQQEHAAGQLLVSFRTEINALSREHVNQQLGGGVLYESSLTGLQVVQLAPQSDLAAKLAQYRARPEVAYAEPNYIVHALRTPNDASYSQLWGMNNTGQTGGVSDVDIDAPEAWSITTGSNQVVVAVIDTGVDYNHPDLAANMWTNTREIPGNNIDDDGNGLIDDVRGYDFVNSDGDPMDDQGHGTHCAGTIGAVGNNGAGVAGVNWNVKIMALKFLAANGSGTTADAVKCIDYAVKMGAKISNNSWGGGGYSQALYDSIAAARDAKHLFIAAAGNDGQNTDTSPNYPSCYDLDNIISVAAVDDKGMLAGFSNFGTKTVDVAAPGVSILSTWLGGAYNTIDGTSMAAPHVTGIAALAAAAHPSWTWSDLKDAILSSGKPLADLRNKIGNPVIASALGAVTATGRGLVFYARFDDGGASVEDFTIDQDWLTNWSHAARLNGGAHFAPAAIASALDSDGDGMPDFWEVAHGTDPLVADGDLDPDGDGLTNFNEYRSGTNPQLADSDNDGVSDADEDFDSDGISNIEEQLLGSNPALIDTDDDGYLDGAAGEYDLNYELQPTNPRYSMSQPNFTQKSLDLSVPAAAMGAYWNGIRLPDSARFRHDRAAMTIETWFRRGNDLNGVIGAFRVNNRSVIELGIEDGRPYALFTTDRGTIYKAGGKTASGVLPKDEWHYLAAVFDDQALSIALYVDTVLMFSRTTEETPLPGDGAFYMGGDGSVAADRVLTDGRLDEYRVWTVARQQVALEAFKYQLIQEGADSSLAAYYRFDDGGLSIEDFQHPIRGDGLGYAWALKASDYGVNATDANGTATWVKSDTAVNVRAAVAGQAAASILYQPEADDGDIDGLPDWWEDFFFLSEYQGYPKGWRMSNAPFGTGGFDTSVLGAGPDNAFFIKDVPTLQRGTITSTELMVVCDGTFDLYVDGVLRNDACTFYPMTPPVSVRKMAAVAPVALADYHLAGGPGITVFTGVNGALLNFEAVTRYAFRVTNPTGVGHFDARVRAFYPLGPPVHVPPEVDLITLGEDDRQPLDTNAWMVYGSIGRTYAAPPVDADNLQWTAYAVGLAPIHFAPRVGMHSDFNEGGMCPWLTYGLTSETIIETGNQPTADLDGDGLTNFYEYLSGTNPVMRDTDNDGMPDSDEDLDHDGLTDLQEQGLMTDPATVDTDDDGHSDADEVLAAFNPIDELSPYVDRVLQVNGASASYVLLSTQARFALSTWTVESWVYPLSFTATGSSIVRRAVSATSDNYWLGIDSAGRPFIRFTPSDGTSAVVVLAVSALPLNAWTHLAASFDPVAHRLDLLVNGAVARSLAVVKECAVTGAGPVTTQVGQLFNGLIDEVRIWNTVRSSQNVVANMLTSLTGSEAGLVSYLRFDDGGVHVTDFTKRQDWQFKWRNSGLCFGAAATVGASDGSPVDGGSGDSNGDGIPDGNQPPAWVGAGPFVTIFPNSYYPADGGTTPKNALLRAEIRVVAVDPDANATVHYTYQWYLNGVGLSGQTLPTLDLAPLNLTSGTISVGITPVDEYGVAGSAQTAYVVVTNTLSLLAPRAVSFLPVQPTTADHLTVRLRNPNAVTATLVLRWYRNHNLVREERQSGIASNGEATFQLADALVAGDVWYFTAYTDGGVSGISRLYSSLTDAAVGSRLVSAQAGSDPSVVQPFTGTVTAVVTPDRPLVSDVLVVRASGAEARPGVQFAYMYQWYTYDPVTASDVPISGENLPTLDMTQITGAISVTRGTTTGGRVTGQIAGVTLTNVQPAGLTPPFTITAGRITNFGAANQAFVITAATIAGGQTTGGVDAQGNPAGTVFDGTLARGVIQQADVIDGTVTAWTVNAATGAITNVTIQDAVLTNETISNAQVAGAAIPGVGVGSRLFCRVVALDVFGNTSDVANSNVVTILGQPAGNTATLAYEPNDTRTQARRILPQSNPTSATDPNAQAHFTKAGDPDWFWFAVPETRYRRSEVIFETNNGTAMYDKLTHNSQTDPGDTLLMLYDTNGRLLRTVDDIGVLGAPGSSLYARFDEVLAPGRYYVMVTSSYLMSVKYSAHLIIQPAAGALVPTDPTQAVLAPTNPTDDDDLVCSAAGSTGSAGTTIVYRYVWLRNGQVMPFGSDDARNWAGINYELANSTTSATLSHVFTAPTDTWTCRVYATDANGVSNGVTSNSVTVQGAAGSNTTPGSWALTITSSTSFVSATTASAVDIGWRQGATHGFDVGIDRVAATAPPAPDGTLAPPAAGTLYSIGLDPAHPALSIDMRTPGAMFTWYVRVELGAGVVSSTLTWDTATVALLGNPMTLTEVNPSDLSSIANTTINMKTVGQLAIAGANVAAKVYRIDYGPGLQSQVLNLTYGWNLVSFAVQPASTLTLDALFRNADGASVREGPIWSFQNGSYSAATMPETRRGYWVFCPLNAGASIPLFGDPDSRNIELQAGWNLVGFGRTMAPPTNAAISVIYGYNGSAYVTPAMVEAGRGYWIYATAPVSIPAR